MKTKQLFIVCSLLFLNLSHSQLFVSNNSYVFNKSNVVYIKGDLELNGANSNFYLRNQGQLVQGTTGASTNKGSGKLSVFPCTNCP